MVQPSAASQLPRLCELSAAAAAARLRIDGPNVLPSRSRRSDLRIVAEVLREPMLALLLGGGIVYLLLGSTAEALVLASFAGFSIAVAIVQETRTEHVLQSLRELAAPRALVMRDGELRRIPGRDVVRGDVLVIERGDRIAADARILEAVDLYADESLLTGESEPVSKRAAKGDEAKAHLPGGGDQPIV